MEEKKKRVIALSTLILVIVVVTVFFIKHFFFQETLDQAARRVLRAMENFDAGTLMAYMSEEEKELTNLSEDKLQRFLDEFLKPHLEGFKPVGSVRSTVFSLQGGKMLSQEYEHPDGRRTYLHVKVMITENGPKALSITYPLYYWFVDTQLPAEEFPSFEERSQFYADTTSKYKRQLEINGLSGIVKASEWDGIRKFTTWDELIQGHLEAKREIKKIKEERGDGGGQQAGIGV